MYMVLTWINPVALRQFGSNMNNPVGEGKSFIDDSTADNRRKDPGAPCLHRAFVGRSSAAVREVYLDTSEV